jgi:hypothetical protein
MSAADTRADLRISDADRDQALAQLSEHFQAGRLTTEELDERSGKALQAKTGRDLAALFTDLPDQAPVPKPSAAQTSTVGKRPGWWLPVVPVVAIPIGVFAIIAAVALGVHLGGGHSTDIHVGFGGVLPLIIVLLVMRRIGWIGNRGQGPFR